MRICSPSNGRNGNFEKAGKEIEEHLKNGGYLDEILGEINKAVEAVFSKPKQMTIIKRASANEQR